MKSNRRRMRLGVCLLSALLFTSHHLVAQEQEWWFDVELIVFERVQSAPLAEQFDTVSRIPSDYQMNLLSDALYPDIRLLVQNLPECEIPETLPTVESIIARHQQWLELQQQEAQLRLDLLTGGADTENTPGPEADRDTAIPAAVTQDLAASETEQSLSEEPITDILTAQQDVISAVDEPLGTNPQDDGVDQDASLTDEEPIVLVPSFTERQQAFIDNLAPIETWEVERRVDCIANSDYLRAAGLTLQTVDDTLPRVARIAKDLEGENWFRSDSPHLLPRSERQLEEFAKDIERLRNHNILLHTVWRQEVRFGRDVADGMRLIAGTDWHKPLHDTQLEQAKLDAQASQEQQDAVAELTTSIDPFAEETSSSEEENLLENDFFEQLNSQLQQPVTQTLINEILFGEEQNAASSNELEVPLWQLDGVFKVYLQYINRVPYLHIDNNLVIHTPTKTDTKGVPIEFKGVELKQLRRVISQQVHYFDHPLMGVIVQIRRHQRPDPIVQETDLLSE